jgi:hypothetical protein
MQFDMRDMTDEFDPQTFERLYSEDSRIGSLWREFDLKGCRYGVFAKVLVTPKDMQVITYEEKMALARAELFVLIDDILDKAGISR